MRRVRDDRGTTVVEYGLIIAGVIVGAISLIFLTGQGLTAFFNRSAGNFADAATCAAGTPGCNTPPTQTPTPTPTQTPTPTPTPTSVSLSGTVPKSTKSSPSVLVVNVLSGVAGASLDVSSVTIATSPNGSQGSGVTASSNGSLAFTAPSNKSGTFVITFTYTVSGITVSGSTLTVSVT